MKRRVTSPVTIARLIIEIKKIERQIDQAFDLPTVGERQRSFIILARHRQVLCDRVRSLLDHEIRRD